MVMESAVTGAAATMMTVGQLNSRDSVWKPWWKLRMTYLKFTVPLKYIRNSFREEQKPCELARRT